MTRNVTFIVTALLVLTLGNGCIIRHEPCMEVGEVIFTGELPFTLTELTSPAPGRNIALPTPEDRITATIDPLPAGSTRFEVRLVSATGIDWWKAVEIRRGPRAAGGCLRRNPGTRVAIAETQDQIDVATASADNNLANASTIVLWKAKALGVHTPMYRMTGNLGALRGQRLTIRWVQD
jgi:hypothetical protein